jgi:uncharacterized membrane protein YraQ (UPF0718 family)/copper chaperone CopZ
MVLELLQRVVSETVRLFVEISPYLILGFFFAGLLHVLLGEGYIKKHFAVSGLASTIKAAVFGVPLPVCSCGVIPLAESLRRDGASKSATMSFLVSTPSSGVDSILATYALMGPVYAVFRPIASFFSGILVGIVTHFQERKENGGSAAAPGENVQTGVQNNKQSKKTFKEAFVYGFRVIPSEIAKWLIIGVVIGGAISALVPADFGSRYLNSPLLSYVVILLISIPIYVCATGSIPIAASLIAKGVLPGAALALLIAGPATNTVTISFLFKKMGARITVIYIASIVVVSVASGLLFDWIWQSMGLTLGAVTDGGAHLPHIIKHLSAVAMLIIFITGAFDVSKFFAKFRTHKGEKDKMVYKIKVPDMNCQHCKMKITGALENLPEIQSVSIDLAAREVEVESNLDRGQVIDYIKEEGYHPVV